MSERDDELHLVVMLRPLDTNSEYMAGVDEVTFTSRNMLVDAAAMNLIVVGEGAHRLSPALKAQVPAPWPQIVGLRHRLAHEYFGMRIDRLWAAAQDSARKLRAQIADRLARL